MGAHHLRFGGTITWELAASPDTLKVELREKYRTAVTIFLGKKTVRAMLDAFESNVAPEVKR